MKHSQKAKPLIQNDHYLGEPRSHKDTEIINQDYELSIQEANLFRELKLEEVNRTLIQHQLSVLDQNIPLLIIIMRLNQRAVFRVTLNKVMWSKSKNESGKVELAVEYST